MFVPEKGRNSGYIMELCACAREGEELGLHYGTLCLCQRRGGTLAILWNSVFVPEKGRNSGYILAGLMQANICVILWLAFTDCYVSLKYSCLEQTRDITMARGGN